MRAQEQGSPAPDAHSEQPELLEEVMKNHRTKIIESKSHHAAFMVKWECACGENGYENTRTRAIRAARTHRFSQQWAWSGLLCSNCACVAANGDDSGVQDGDPRPLSLVPEGIYVIVRCCIGRENCGETHRDADFQTKCDGCGMVGSPLGFCPAIGDDRR